MMDHLTRRYDDLLLAKSKLVDNSALFATLKSKNLGTPAIEECLRKLHENQNISENTMKPYRRELLSDKIKEVDEFHILKNKYPQIEIYDYGNKLITAGFVDCHMHYPQTRIIASYGKRLLDWLNDYTFPEEQKFENYDYAKDVASLTLDLCLKNGTTTLASFCTTSVNSVDAIFEEAETRKMCVIAGKTCMDRNAPKLLTDSVKRSYDI